MDRVAHITVLADNRAKGSGSLAEHGLAFWIETDGRGLLFDTGQGAALPHNAQNLGVPGTGQSSAKDEGTRVRWSIFHKGGT